MKAVSGALCSIRQFRLRRMCVASAGPFLTIRRPIADDAVTLALYFRIMARHTRIGFTHPTTRAAQFCNYCNRPFCSDCLETNTGSIIALGTCTYMCHLCRADINRLKQQPTIRDRDFCLYHPDVPVRRTCASCSNQMCQFCTYLPVTGLFSKRVGSTAYCFSCIRDLISQHKLRHAVIEHFSGSTFKGYMF